MAVITQPGPHILPRRKVAAMGGMSAQIPIKDDPKANEIAMAKVRADKLREVKNGHDGTWIAHPLINKIAVEIFNEHMVGPNQVSLTQKLVLCALLTCFSVPCPSGGCQGRRCRSPQHCCPRKDHRSRHSLQCSDLARIQRRMGRRQRLHPAQLPHGGRRDGGDHARAAVAVRQVRLADGPRGARHGRVHRQDRRRGRPDAQVGEHHGEEPRHRRALPQEAGPPGVAVRVLDERLDVVLGRCGRVPAAVPAERALEYSIYPNSLFILLRRHLYQYYPHSIEL